MLVCGTIVVSWRKWSALLNKLLRAGDDTGAKPRPDSDGNTLLGKGPATFLKPGKVFGTPLPPQETGEA